MQPIQYMEKTLRDYNVNVERQRAEMQVTTSPQQFKALRQQLQRWEVGIYFFYLKYSSLTSIEYISSPHDNLHLPAERQAQYRNNKIKAQRILANRVGKIQSTISKLENDLRKEQERVQVEASIKRLNSQRSMERKNSWPRSELSVASPLFPVSGSSQQRMPVVVGEKAKMWFPDFDQLARQGQQQQQQQRVERKQQTIGEPSYASRSASAKVEMKFSQNVPRIFPAQTERVVQSQRQRRVETHSQTQQYSPGLSQKRVALQSQRQVRLPAKPQKRRRSSWPPKDKQMARKRLQVEMRQCERAMQEERQSHGRATQQLRHEQQLFRKQMKAKFQAHKSKDELDALRTQIVNVKKSQNQRFQKLSAAHKSKMQSLQTQLARINMMYSTLVAEDFAMKAQQMQKQEALKAEANSSPGKVIQANVMTKEKNLAQVPASGLGPHMQGGGGIELPPASHASARRLPSLGNQQRMARSQQSAQKALPLQVQGTVREQLQLQLNPGSAAGKQLHPSLEVGSIQAQRVQQQQQQQQQQQHPQQQQQQQWQHPQQHQIRQQEQYQKQLQQQRHHHYQQQQQQQQDQYQTQKQSHQHYQQHQHQQQHQQHQQSVKVKSVGNFGNKIVPTMDVNAQ